MKNKIIAVFALLAIATLFLTGCGKCPSFTSAEGENLIREIMNEQGKDFLDKLNHHIGSCYQKPVIISIVEDQKAINSKIDERWYEMTYKRKHLELKSGRIYCTCSEDEKDSITIIVEKGKDGILFMHTAGGSSFKK